MRTGNARRHLLMLVLAGCTSGCFFYDSRWGEATKSQQRVAEHSMPKDLASAEGGPANGRAAECSTELQVRVYDASSVGTSAGFGEVVERANQVLLPDLQACLTVSEVRSWKQTSGSAPLAEQLAELKALDGGADVDLVVGLSPATQLLEFSFSQLGMAEFLGKHLVVRSASDARELEAIEAAFPDLDAEARRDLYAKRKLHKATALLLHELGHALGAVHTTQRDELMYPSYSVDMQGFSQPTRALLQVSLDARQEAPEARVTPALADRMLNLLKATPAGTWNPEDFEARVKAVEQVATVQPDPSAVPPPVSGLTPADQVAYVEAGRLLEAKQPQQAWERAKPLFDRYAESYDVQDLRCKIAMQLGLAWEATRDECAPLMRLTGVPAPR